MIKLKLRKSWFKTNKKKIRKLKKSKTRSRNLIKETGYHRLGLKTRRCLVKPTGTLEPNLSSPQDHVKT